MVFMMQHNIVNNIESITLNTTKKHVTMQSMLAPCMLIIT